MSFQVTGKVTFIGVIEGGISKRGNQWQKLIFVIEEDSRDRFQIPFEIWNEHIKDANLVLNETYVVDFDIQGSVYNDRWYSKNIAFYVRPLSAMREDGVQDRIAAVANGMRV